LFLSPPCGGGAPRPDRNRGGWGGVRINVSSITS